MKLAATATPAQHTDESAEPYQPLAAPAEERAMDETANGQRNRQARTSRLKR